MFKDSRLASVILYGLASAARGRLQGDVWPVKQRNLAQQAAQNCEVHLGFDIVKVHLLGKVLLALSKLVELRVYGFLCPGRLLENFLRFVSNSSKLTHL